MRYQYKVRLSSIILFLELFLVIPCDFFTAMKGASNIFRLLVLIALILELLFFLKHSSKYTILNVNWLILLFFVYQWAITILHKSEPFVYSLNFLNTGILLFLITCRCQSFDPKGSLKVIRNYFYVIILLNFLSVLIFPKGLSVTYSRSGNMHINYFLGVDNQFGKYLFPGFSIIWFCTELNKGKAFLTLSTMLMILITYIYMGSGAGLIVSFALVLLYVIYTTGIGKKIISFKVFSVIIAVISASVITGAGILHNSNNFAMRLILSITGKSSTFSGRINIWAVGVAKFLKHPVFGYGKTVGEYCIKIGMKEYGAHNVILQVLLESGIIGLALFIMPIVVACVKSERRILDCPAARLIYIGIFTTMLYFMMEKGNVIPLYSLTSILGYYSFAATQKNGTKNLA